jgi:hypothetical protein
MRPFIERITRSTTSIPMPRPADRLTHLGCGKTWHKNEPRDFRGGQLRRQVGLTSPGAALL